MFDSIQVLIEPIHANDELYKLAQKRKEMIIELLEACSDLHNYQSGRKHYEAAVVKYQQIEQLRQECKL